MRGPSIIPGTSDPQPGACAARHAPAVEERCTRRKILGNGELRRPALLPPGQSGWSGVSHAFRHCRSRLGHTPPGSSPHRGQGQASPLGGSPSGSGTSFAPLRPSCRLRLQFPGPTGGPPSAALRHGPQAYVRMNGSSISPPEAKVRPDWKNTPGVPPDPWLTSGSGIGVGYKVTTASSGSTWPSAARLSFHPLSGQHFEVGHPGPRNVRQLDDRPGERVVHTDELHPEVSKHGSRGAAAQGAPPHRRDVRSSRRSLGPRRRTGTVAAHRLT